ncbi:MAG: hypothetical protein QM757_23335 [Paludibaculum sp.]
MRTVGTTSSQSKYNSINLDVGHFTEAINASPIPFIKEHHDRITSFHLKDKKYSTKGGGNAPWGQGDTPVEGGPAVDEEGEVLGRRNIELQYDGFRFVQRLGRNEEVRERSARTPWPELFGRGGSRNGLRHGEHTVCNELIPALPIGVRWLDNRPWRQRVERVLNPSGQFQGSSDLRQSPGSAHPGGENSIQVRPSALPSE